MPHSKAQQECALRPARLRYVLCFPNRNALHCMVTGGGALHHRHDHRPAIDNSVVHVTKDISTLCAENEQDVDDRRAHIRRISMSLMTQRHSELRRALTTAVLHSCSRAGDIRSDTGQPTSHGSTKSMHKYAVNPHNTDLSWQ